MHSKHQCTPRRRDACSTIRIRRRNHGHRSDFVTSPSFVSNIVRYCSFVSSSGAMCVGRVPLCTIALMASSAIAVAPARKKHRTDLNVTSLVAQGKQTKTALIETLSHLKQVGILQAGITKRDLTEAAEYHAKQKGPYGPVVQKLLLDAPGLQYLHIVNPFALIHHLTMISIHFATMMHQCCTPGRPLRLIIYADEMNPGNPFRPEKSRTLQCIY